MPTQNVWIAPELFLTHSGVQVFHTYKDDDFDQGANKYSFTVDAESDDEPFDVRKLDVPSLQLLKQHPPFMAANSNPAFKDASDTLKAEWRAAWDLWNAPGGGEDSAIRQIICDAIDVGLITPLDDSPADGDSTCTKSKMRLFEFGTAPAAKAEGYSMTGTLLSTPEALHEAHHSEDVIFVYGAAVHGRPGVFEFARFVRLNHMGI